MRYINIYVGNRACISHVALNNNQPHVESIQFDIVGAKDIFDSVIDRLAEN